MFRVKLTQVVSMKIPDVKYSLGYFLEIIGTISGSFPSSLGDINIRVN